MPMTLPSAAECYHALVARDAAYEGRFIAAVRTTGIFCRPTCRARKPKSENVEFFATTREALVHGYRPCKVCAPLAATGPEAPAFVEQLLAQLTADPATRIRDAHLRAQGLEPATVRRWFVRTHGLTFQAYQRLYRLNTAFKQLQTGAPVTDAAFGSGYESLSGFQASFRAVFGAAPSHSRQQQVIDLTRLDTPLGPMLAAATAAGVCLLEFTDRRGLETELQDLSRRLQAPVVQGYNPHFEPLRAQLAEYFGGTRQEFTVPLHTPGSTFQQRVWQQLQQIPYGRTRSYGQQAAALQRPEAVRAVAAANGQNRVAILIPCHRVIGADGKLTGYGGGLWRKQRLLALEAAAPTRAGADELPAR